MLACGPKSQIDVGVREAHGDVVYGDQSKPTVAPRAPEATMNPGFPGFIAPPPAPSTLRSLPNGTTPAPLATATPTPPPPSPSCPAADPFAVPAVAADTYAPNPPDEATYQFRRSGRVTRQQTTLMGAAVTRSISNVQTTNGLPDNRTVYQFVQTQEEEGVRTATTYQVDPGGT